MYSNFFLKHVHCLPIAVIVIGKMVLFERLIEYDISKTHLNVVIEFAALSKEKGRIDLKLIKQAKSVAKYRARSSQKVDK